MSRWCKIYTRIQKRLKKIILRLNLVANQNNNKKKTIRKNQAFDTKKNQRKSIIHYNHQPKKKTKRNEWTKTVLIKTSMIICYPEKERASEWMKNLDIHLIIIIIIYIHHVYISIAVHWTMMKMKYEQQQPRKEKEKWKKDNLIDVTNRQCRWHFPRTTHTHTIDLELNSCFVFSFFCFVFHCLLFFRSKQFLYSILLAFGNSIFSMFFSPLPFINFKLDRIFDIWWFLNCVSKTFFSKFFFRENFSFLILPVHQWID